MRCSTLAVVAFLASAAAWIAAPATPAGSTCAAAGAHHASVVVEHGGTVIQRCVAFDGDSISGEQALKLTGIEYATQTFGGFGDAVCQMDNVPVQYTDCLGKDNYWAYFVARGGGVWQYSSIGMTNIALHDGDAEGFRYLPVGGTIVVPPAPAACPAAPAPTPVVTAAPTKAAPVVTAAPKTARPATPGPTAASADPSLDPALAAASAGPSDAASATPSASVSAVATDELAPPGLASASPSAAGSTAGSNGSGSGGSSTPDGGAVLAGAAGVGLVAFMAAREVARRRERR